MFNCCIILPVNIDCNNYFIQLSLTTIFFCHFFHSCSIIKEKSTNKTESQYVGTKHRITSCHESSLCWKGIYSSEITDVLLFLHSDISFEIFVLIGTRKLHLHLDILELSIMPLNCHHSFLRLMVVEQNCYFSIGCLFNKMSFLKIRIVQFTTEDYNWKRADHGHEINLSRNNHYHYEFLSSQKKTFFLSLVKHF